MAYAQKNYSQLQGINGHYKISAIGCFLTAFCNLQQDFGYSIDPPTLDNFFRDHGIYIDVDDGVRDDLGWGSVSSLDGNTVVSRTVDHGTNRNAGWPNSNQSIVRFYYKSIQSGQMIFHFCKVADAAAHTIIDSWDGQVKQSPYGEPTAFAEYVHNSPQPVQPAGTSQPVAAVSGKKLFLPTAGGYWRVYPLNKSPVVGNEVGKLWPGNPAWAPGLTYDILANPMPNIYRIHTESWGDVNIYAGPDTPAQFVDGAPAPIPAPVAPPPAPTPAPAPAAPPEAPKPSNTVYAKLAEPLNLVVNKNPTNWWALGFVDDAHAQAAAQLPEGAPFLAYGKAQRTDGDKPCYYMTKEDFADADTSGRPVNNNGVNTVDLSLPVATPAPVEPAPAAAAPAAPVDNTVPVKVVPNNDAWKTTFKVNSAGEYIANASTTIHDLDGDGPSEQLVRGQTVHVAGTFTKGGIEYYRTKKKAEAGLWYGIPKIALQESSLDADGDLFNLDMIDELRHEMGKFSTKEKVLKAAGQAEAARFNLVKWFTGLFHRNKNK